MHTPDNPPVPPGSVITLADLPNSKIYDCWNRYLLHYTYLRANPDMRDLPRGETSAYRYSTAQAVSDAKDQISPRGFENFASLLKSALQGCPRILPIDPSPDIIPTDPPPPDPPPPPPK